MRECRVRLPADSEYCPMEMHRHGRGAAVLTGFRMTIPKQADEDIAFIAGQFIEDLAFAKRTLEMLASGQVHIPKKELHRVVQRALRVVERCDEARGVLEALRAAMLGSGEQLDYAVEAIGAAEGAQRDVIANARRMATFAKDRPPLLVQNDWEVMAFVDDVEALRKQLKGQQAEMRTYLKTPSVSDAELDELAWAFADERERVTLNLARITGRWATVLDEELLRRAKKVVGAYVKDIGSTLELIDAIRKNSFEAQATLKRAQMTGFGKVTTH